jgi:hypothetical protein
LSGDVRFNIAANRETPLNKNHTVSNNGCDKGGWDETPFKVLRIMNIDTEGRKIDGDQIIDGHQRLIAFLEETDRVSVPVC